MQTGQYLIAVQQLECPIDDPPATGGIEDIQEFRFDALLKIGACPLGRADRAECQRSSLQFVPAKEAVAAVIQNSSFNIACESPALPFPCYNQSKDHYWE